jgi:hypothetical protein
MHQLISGKLVSTVLPNKSYALTSVRIVEVLSISLFTPY